MEFLEDVFVPIAKLESQKNQNKIGKKYGQNTGKITFCVTKNQKKNVNKHHFWGKLSAMIRTQNPSGICRFDVSSGPVLGQKTCFETTFNDLQSSNFDDFRLPKML